MYVNNVHNNCFTGLWRINNPVKYVTFIIRDKFVDPKRIEAHFSRGGAADPHAGLSFFGVCYGFCATTTI